MIPRFDAAQALQEHARAAATDPDMDIEERAAIIAECCGVSQNEVARRVRREPEDATTHPAAERIAHWLAVFDRISLLGECPTLCAASIDFALSPWACPAVITGWSDAELFGLPAGLVQQRTLRTLHILAIDRHGVTLMTGRGIAATFERHHFRCSDSRPWWMRNQQKAVA